MADMEKDSVTVTFLSESKSKGAFIETEEAENYSGPHDDDKVFNVFYSECSKPNVSSDVGVVKERQTNVSTDKIEILEFVDEKEASLRYKPSGSITQKYSTVGSNWSRNGKKIRFSEKKTGLLKLSYQTLCDRWGFYFTAQERIESKPPAALIIFKCGSEVTSEKVEGHYNDVSIKVVDACNGDPVSGASVTVGNKKEVTDKDGNVTFSNLIEGEKSVKITAEGYIDSDKDPLDNDSINVSYDEN